MTRSELLKARKATFYVATDNREHVCGDLPQIVSNCGTWG